MIYEYHCDKCDITFDVIKDHTLHRRVEHCTCGENARRIYRVGRPNVDKMEAEYYHGFGQVVRTRRQRQELMKVHNCEEIGNEKVSTVHKYYADAREHKRKAGWDKVMRETI